MSEMRYASSGWSFLTHLARPNQFGRYARTLCGREMPPDRGRRRGWLLGDVTADGAAVECRTCARRLTEAEETRTCITCGGRCLWAEDAWTCTKCGDEWPEEALSRA